MSLISLGLAAGLAIAPAIAPAIVPALDPAASRWPWLWAAAAAALLYALQFVLGRALGVEVSPAARGIVRASAKTGAGKAVAGGERDLAAVISAFPDPCVAVDRRGVVLAVSPATAPLFPTIVTGRPLSFAIRAPEFVEALDAVLNGAAGRTVRITQRVPVERSFEIVATPLVSERRRGALVVLRDLTGQQRVEQMRVDFIANASHELRTPLATVMGFIETLQGPARNDAVARDRFLIIMREQSLRMKRLIDDLLSLSRIEGHSHHAPSTPVDVVDVASQIADSLRAMAGEVGVAINFTAPDTPVIVAGDRDELLRVVENLVENAVKYGESGQRVDIDVSVRPMSGANAGQMDEVAPAELALASGAAAEAIIAVRDSGPGISAEHLPRLTERFYRAPAQASSGKGDFGKTGSGKTGSGLGLSIVKHIVNRHRGRLHIDSTAGEGTVVRVVLPLALPSVASMSLAPMSHDPAPGQYLG